MRVPGRRVATLFILPLATVTAAFAAKVPPYQQGNDGILTVDRNVPAYIHMLTPPKKTDTRPLQVPTNEMMSRLIHRVDPKDPRIPMEADITATVVFRAKILKDGSIGRLTVVSGPRLLIQPAADAVKQWKFNPYSIYGTPIEVETTIPLHIEFGR